jgi:molybdopterin molybdotransferase
VPPELTQSGPTGTVEILETVAPESEIERRASHFARGTTVLRSGRRLRPPDVALLATACVEHVIVTRRPRVALVLAAGAAMAGDAESSASILQPLVARDGGALVGITRVERTAAAIRQAALAAAADTVLVVGGPSRGRDGDAGAALADGGKLDVAELALSPGGSLAFGRTGGGAWLFALPAASAACFWAYEMIVGRAVRRLAGRDPVLPFRQVAMRLTRKLVSAIGMTEICPVRRQEGGVEPLSGFSPFNLLALGRADGFVIVAEGSEGMPAGTVVPVHLFDNDAIPMTPAP